MRSPLRLTAFGVGLTLAAMAAAVVDGCASKPADPEDIGVVRLELTSIPSDVSCLRLTATGARTVTQQFDVTPGSDASLLVTGLPTGTVTITAYAFAAACATAGDVTTANWFSDPQTLNVSTSDIVDLSLVMHRNGRVRVGVDFQGDVTPAPNCKDGIQNGDETGVDCGGSICRACDARSCIRDENCMPGETCNHETCTPNPACSNGIQDGTETGVDCGGSCAACPTCKDGIQNGDETGVDCGGSCRACGARSCIRDENCMPGETCNHETCTPNPACSNGIQDGTETGVDCGGSCAACPTCKDGIQNGDETGVDCGGSMCRACGARSCIRDENCMAGEMCIRMTCQALDCTVPSGAVAWWHADDNFDDAIGGHTGTPVGNVTFVPGVHGSGFGFDGVSSAYVDAFPSPDFDFTTDFTIDAWINISVPGGSGRIVDKIHAFNNDGYLFDLVSGHLRFIAGAVGLVTADQVANGSFIHVAAAYDANRIAIFVNGVLVAQGPANAAVVSTNGLPVRIAGDSDGASPFPGTIDEPRLFNRGLSDAEVRSLFQQAINCP
jgi:hypothetical protein